MIKKVLVVSDSHSRTDRIKQSIRQHASIDMFIHLGDLEDNPRDIQEYLDRTSNYQYEGSEYKDVRSIFVRGNCDRFCNIILFGHTHIYLYVVINGIRLINPGSIVFPLTGRG